MSRQDDPVCETCQDQVMEWLCNQLIIMNFSEPDGVHAVKRIQAFASFVVVQDKQGKCLRLGRRRQATGFRRKTAG